MEEYTDKIGKLEMLIKQTDTIAEKYEIIFLSSNKYKTQNLNDYDGYSVISEFFSLEEQSTICTAFQNIGFKMKQFFNEEEFIQFVSTTNENLSKYIVVNSAQKGTKIGRKSLIPALCNLYDIKYIGSNPYVVSLCRDKYRGSTILKQHGIHTPLSWLYDQRFGWLNGSPQGFDHKLIIKPNYESSSIGVDENSIGYYNHEFQKKVEEMSELYNQEILVEEFIYGYETELPVICCPQPLAFFPLGINLNQNQFMGNQILNYATRSADNYTFYDFSKKHSDISDNMLRTASKVMKLLNITGFGRVDFRIRENGNYYVTDVSTNPHYTLKSSYYHLFKQLGFDYDELIRCLISSSFGGEVL